MIHGKLENVNAYLALGVTDMRKSSMACLCLSKNSLNSIFSPATCSLFAIAGGIW